jgi:hypothetical protein
MKSCLAIFLALFSTVATATIRTVSNDPALQAQFTTFDAAQTASATGDTIYLQGTTFQYPPLNVRKRLVIIGSGFAANNPLGQSTKVESINLVRNATDDATGSTIMGLLIAGSVLPTGGAFAVPNNITLMRNSIGGNVSLSPGSCGGTYPTGWVIVNNIFFSRIDGGGTISCGGPVNTLIANNIFQNGNINGFVSATVIIDHNIFLGVTGGVLAQLTNLTITNNIFSRSTGFVLDPSASVLSCVFNNNLSNLTTIANPTFYNPGNSFNHFIASAGASNTGTGNIIGQNPLFIVNANPDAYSSLDNYRLQSSSLGKNAATDGTDLGIYGGTYPFPSGGAPGSGFDTRPLPPVPQVTNMSIQNPSLAPGAQLKVTIQATVNN